MNPSPARSQGLSTLTAQERRIAAAVGVGASNKNVAGELVVSVKTVEFHLANIYRKLGIAGRSELAHLVGTGSRRVLVDSTAAGNLPAAGRALIGRDDDLAAFDSLVGANRLLTLTGPGGVGKTRLALGGAHLAASRFADGAWFIDLSSLTNETDVALAAMTAFELQQRNANPTPDDVAAALGRQQRLIVLDNCEHVVGQAAELAAAITHWCPRTVIVATSRERLDCAAERVIAVEPLSTDCADGGSPASRLFVERATALDGSFVPSAPELEMIDRICRRLDGLPLAVELAAARLKRLGIAEIHDRLDDRFALLTRRAPRTSRHHSLSASIEWSVDALTDHERSTLESLSVIVGDFDVPAAAAVCAPEPRRVVEDDIGALVERSLLKVTSDPGGRRYQFLESIREFANRRLFERGARDDVRRRHLDHVRSFVHDTNLRLRTEAETTAHRAFVTDWHNIRTAINTACELDDGPAACQIVTDVLFWSITRLRAEPGEWCHRVRALPSTTDLPARVAATAGAAYYALMSGNLPQAVELIHLARDEEQRLGELPEPIVPAVESFLVTNDHQIAVSCEMQRRGEASNTPFWQVLGLVHEAIARASRSARASTTENGQARPHHRTADLGVIRNAVSQASAFGNPNLIGASAMALGIALATTHPRQAQRYLERAAAITEPLGLALLTGQCSNVLAKIHIDAGRWTQALEIILHSLRLHLRSGALADLTWDLSTCVGPLLELGELSTAALVIELTHDAATYPHLADMLAENAKRISDTVATNARRVLATWPEHGRTSRVAVQTISTIERVTRPTTDQHHS